MFKYPAIERQPLEHVCFTEPLRLGHAEILRQSPRGLLVYDRPGKLMLLTAEDVPAAEALLDGSLDGTDKEQKAANAPSEAMLGDTAVFHGARPDDILAGIPANFFLLADEALAPAIARFGLPHTMRCRQAAYLKKERPAADPRLVIEIPDAAAFARILSVYHMDSPAELTRRRDAGELFFARTRDGADVGFVGLHPEGCFGLLEVFPDQRGHGYGAALEAHILRFCMDTGRIPYCQVEEGNEVSFHLQRKLGLEISEQIMHMAWNSWE